MTGIGAQELLVLFVLVIPYVVATAGLVPKVARAKGHSGFEWFMIALFATPLLALIALAAMPDKRTDQRETPADGPEVPEFKWRKE
jgi:hypothetical protein